MGNVAITFRLMPEDPSTDLRTIKDRVQKALGTSLKGMQEKDVAFGLRALLALAVVPDEAGASDRIEQALSGIPGVSSVEAIDLTLV
ncbi:MAG TPA: elongation factor 1-beta [Thermoplasmata archaeon]|jgi:elongation factor 1-beta